MLYLQDERRTQQIYEYYVLDKLPINEICNITLLTTACNSIHNLEKTFSVIYFRKPSATSSYFNNSSAHRK